MEMTLIVQGLDSYFVKFVLSLYPIFRDLLERYCDNILQNVFSLKERLDRYQ